MSLSEDLKKIIVVALANASKGAELSAAIDASTAKVAASNFVLAGLLIATTADTTTDATTLGLAVGDTVAFIKDADQTLATIVTANTFPVAPAVGDLIQHYKSV